MMKKLLFLLVISYGTSYAQTQIGADIDGEFLNDLSGYCISLSSDGSIIAISSPLKDSNSTDSGQCRVYQNNLGVWTQVGNDINGSNSFDEFGRSISLSSNGDIIAIGAPNNDENGFNSGNVRVFKNVLGVWTQIGNNITGEITYNHFGISVSLSSDGNILAVGAPFTNGIGDNSGYVKIYRNVSNNWIQIGNKIQGSSYSMFGRTLTLSNDGNIIAIYSIGGNGSVKIFKNISDNWIQIGDDINGDSEYDQFGNSISLSSDGNIIAIGANLNDNNIMNSNSGQVKVFENIQNIWTQIGNSIYGEANSDQLGVSVSLSDDGRLLSVGSPYANNSGKVSIFKFNSGIWNQISTINAEFQGDKCGISTSLSSDGYKLAIGSSENIGNGTYSGHTRIFDLSSILSNDSFIFNNFSIYPNPSNGVVNISLENNLQIEKVTIYNQLGQVVKTATTNIITTSELPKGSYFVEVITDKGKATKQLIVN